MARKKTKKTFSRRLQSGWAACPTTDFWSFKDYARTELDKKEFASVIKAYVKSKYNKADVKKILAAPDWYFNAYHVASSIKWKDMGQEFPVNWNPEQFLTRYFTAMKDSGHKNLYEKKDENKTPKKSIQDIVKERTSDFIAGIEEILDEFSNNDWTKLDKYSVYDELKKNDAAYNTAKGVYDYYSPSLDEFEELKEKSDPQLNEGYNHLSAQKRNRFIKFFKMIVSEAEQYMLSKKAVRKIRKPKAKTADKQIENLKYLKESNEYKITSIDPLSLIGSMRVYTFNTKSRILTEYVCNAPGGFTVKGTTLQSVDMEASREIKLRNPEEFLPLVIKSTPTKINQAWKKLTTKTNTPNARINKDTIILKVMNK